MRYNQGWVKIHRKIVEKEWLSNNLIAVGLWDTLIRFANFQDKEALFNGKMLTLKRGQLITSLRELKGDTPCSKDLIEKLLNLMSESHLLTQEVRNKGRLITICNYEKYQGLDEDDQKQNRNNIETEPKHNRNRTAYDKKERTKEGKKRKEDNTLYTLKSEGQSELIPDDILSLADKWLEFACKEMPWKAEDPKWTRQSFGKELLRICKVMDVKVDGLHMVLDFIKKDDFWIKNAISPFGLLKKSSRNDMRKIDNIIARLKTKQDRTDDTIREWIEDDNKSDIWAVHEEPEHSRP